MQQTVLFSALCVLIMSSSNWTNSSGSHKRKRKKEVDKLIQSERTHIHNFFKKSDIGASTALINPDD